MSEQPAGTRDRSFLIVGVSSALVTAALLVAMLTATDGRFVPQIPDLFVSAQYARGFANGHAFQFNPGEAPTTGATSLLHTVVLAVPIALGLDGEGLIAFAILGGACAALGTGLLARRAAARIAPAGQGTPLLAALLVVVNGPLAWSFHTGGDIALTLLLSTWLFSEWIASAGGGDRWIVPATLLVLARPEALILAVCLGALSPEARRSVRAWIPSVAGVLLLVGLRLATGAAPTSYARKLLWENWGAFASLQLAAEYWNGVVRGILLGLYPPGLPVGFEAGQAPWFAPPFALIFAAVAFTESSAETRLARRFFAAAALTAVAITPNIHIGQHANRYLLFALPPFLVLVAVGMRRSAALIGRAVLFDERRAFLWLAAGAVGFGALSTARYSVAYAANASAVHRRDGAIFDFVRRLPSDAVFLNNGTSIEFMTGRRAINLSGVMTPRFAEILPTETEAAAFDLLSRDDAPSLPGFLIAYDSYVEASPGWTALVAGPAIFRTASLEGSELAVYPTRADLVGRQRTPARLRPVGGLALVDALNVTDPVDERAHDYRWRSRVGTRAFFGALGVGTYPAPVEGAVETLADGGRVILGGESFEMATPVAGDYVLVARMHPRPAARIRQAEGERRAEVELTSPSLRIETDRGATAWLAPRLDPGWTEVALPIPRELLTPPRTRFRLEGRYSSYSYWLFGPAAGSGRPPLG